MINNGTYILNQKVLSEQNTVAITGLGRSGTTMLSRLVSEIGMPVGMNLTPNTLEDKDIQKAIKQKDISSFEKAVDTRNSEWENWAFKCPALRGDLKSYLDLLRNPRLIVIFRDVLAISIRNNISMNFELNEGLLASVKNYEKLINNIRELDIPILLISYEKALIMPEETVASIANFIGYDVLPNQLEVISQTIKASDPRYLGS